MNSIIHYSINKSDITLDFELLKKEKPMISLIFLAIIIGADTKIWERGRRGKIFIEFREQKIE